MPDDEEVIRHLGDFIQQRAHGVTIRQWLALNEVEMVRAMYEFRLQATPLEVEAMARTLLQVAAGYPGSEVRRKLVLAYGLFMQEGMIYWLNIS